MTTATESALFKRATSGVLGLHPYEPGMPIDELQRRLGVADVIKLASNENPLGPGEKVRQALAEHIGKSDLALYPDGGGFRLKQRIAQFHDIEPDRITLGNGSNDILEFVSRVFLGPDRASLFSAYAFAVYPIVTQAQGARAIVVPAHPADHDMPYGHDLEAFARAMEDEVAVVFIANPNNPTGTWLTAQSIETFLAKVPESTLVVLDEAYQEYLEPDLRPDSRGLLDRYPNLIVTRTFSKTYGLASLRAGYGLSSPGIADLLNRVRQPFNMNSLALLAAEVALDDQAHVERSVTLNAAQMQRLRSELEAMKLTVLPSQANFLTIGFGRESAPIHQGLLERGIIVRPMASYGLSEFLRVTVGTAAQNTRFLDALKAVLAQ